MSPSRRLQPWKAPACLRWGPSRVRYEEDQPTATRVIVHVEYSDGSAAEYDAVEPQDFRVEQGMATRRTGLAVGHGGGFAGVSHAVPRLSVHLVAHPKYNLRIWTSGNTSREKALRALREAAGALGYRLEADFGLRSGKREEPRVTVDDGPSGRPGEDQGCGARPGERDGGVAERGGARVHRTVAEELRAGDSGQRG